MLSRRITKDATMNTPPPGAKYWKFSKIHTPALFKFIPLTKYNHINHILLYQSTQFFFYIKEPIKSALKWIILAMKNFVLDSNIHCTRRPANHVFLSLGRGCVFLKISRGWILRSAPPRAIFSLWKFSKIHTPALFKFIPLAKYNHVKSPSVVPKHTKRNNYFT